MAASMKCPSTSYAKSSERCLERKLQLRYSMSPRWNRPDRANTASPSAMYSNVIGAVVFGHVPTDEDWSLRLNRWLRSRETPSSYRCTFIMQIENLNSIYQVMITIHM